MRRPVVYWWPCITIAPSSRFFRSAGNLSYAAYELENIVWPPSDGISMP